MNPVFVMTFFKIEITRQTGLSTGDFGFRRSKLSLDTGSFELTKQFR
jgi:hypothetical protein